MPLQGKEAAAPGARGRVPLHDALMCDTCAPRLLPRAALLAALALTACQTESLTCPPSGVAASYALRGAGVGVDVTSCPFGIVVRDAAGKAVLSSSIPDA